MNFRIIPQKKYFVFLLFWLHFLPKNPKEIMGFLIKKKRKKIKKSCQLNYFFGNDQKNFIKPT